MDYSLYKCSLVRDKNFEYYGTKVNSSETVSDMLDKLGISDAPEEYVYMFCYDVKFNLIGLHEVAHGELSGCPVHPREIFKRAITNNAAAIILAHNHPSGDPHPSKDDKDITKRIVECGKILGIKVIDHVIVSENSYLSLRGENASMFED